MIEPLGPRERALIAAARDALGPDAVQVARIKAHVAGVIAAGGAGVAVTGGAAAAGGAAAVATKVAVVAVAAAAIGAAAYTHFDVPAPTVMPIALPTTADETTGDVVAPQLTVAAHESPPPAPAPPPAREPAATATSAPPPRADLKREIVLVDNAIEALHRRDYAAALAVIHTYDVETLGGGQLAEDAFAVAVEALCLSGDPAAPAQLAVFFERWPRSAQRPRLAAACP